MQKKFNGFIDHEFKGHKVRLYGEITGLNESDDTLRMVFENGVEKNGIPVEIVTLDEAAIDDIRNAFGKAGKWLRGKFKLVGGMVRKLWNGIAVPFNRAVNIGQLAAAGRLPEGVGFYPSAQAYAEAKMAGAQISGQNAPLPAKVDSNGLDEDEIFRDFWRNIFKDVIRFKNEGKGEADATAFRNAYVRRTERMFGKAVAESMAKNPALDMFFGCPKSLNEMAEECSALGMRRERLRSGLNVSGLNEANDTTLVDSPEQGNGMSAIRSENVAPASMAEIVEHVMTQLEALFKVNEYEPGSPAENAFIEKTAQSRYVGLVGSGMPEDEAREAAMLFALETATQSHKQANSVKPLMIWGAPGIGKTSIIQQTRQMFKQRTVGTGSYGSTSGYNINMLEVVLSKMTADDFTLATKGEDPMTGDMRMVNGIQSWIPCWQRTGDARLDYLSNQAANLKMNTPQTLAKHGIDVRGDIDAWRRSRKNGVVLNGDEGGYSKDTLDKFDKLNREEALHEAFDWAALRAQMQDSLANGDKGDELTDGGIIFFDELTRAPKGVMNVIMNLVNDRKVGEGWELGSHWMIVAAANRFWEMTGIDSTWEEAFGTRFTHFVFIPTWEDWEAWAMGYNFDPVKGRYDKTKKHANRIDQDIIDFLRSARQAGVSSWYEKTDKESVDKNVQAKVYANPRSWQTASDLMVLMAKKKNPDRFWITKPDGVQVVNLSNEDKLKCIKAAVGIGAKTYGQFKTWTNTRFFDNAMIESILEYGNISGGPTKLIETIEKKGTVPKNTKVVAGNTKILQDYIPVNDKGDLVTCDATMLNKLSDIIFSMVDWSQIDNIKVANLLAYFAVLNISCMPGNPTWYNEQQNKLLGHIFKLYTRDHRYTLKTLPKDVWDVCDISLNPNKRKDGKKVVADWLKPAKNVTFFVNGYAGLDNPYSEDVSGSQTEDEIISKAIADAQSSKNIEVDDI